MYNFIDTTQVSEGALLPSEAMQINGQFIENLIPGYRTISVSGREALSAEVDFYETGIRDGATLKYKRYPTRTILITYQLIAATSEEFRAAFNELGRILNVKEAELIFNDELDKYFKGTPAGIGEVPAGRNSIIGEFEIICTDPFKYSVVEYEAEATLDDSSILIDYAGTYKSFPILQTEFYNEDEGTAALTGNGDCGFVAFFNEVEKIIQLGDPDEIDGTNTNEKSQTLINQIFPSADAWGTTAKALWAVNSGVVLPSDVQQVGNVGMAIASYATKSESKTTSATLIRTTSTANAPTIHYTVTAKASSRTADSVFVSVAITASLGSSGSYFGYGYSLTGSIYIGGTWHNAVLKETSDYWEGRTGHTKNMSFIVSGLTEAQTVISGIKFKATRPDGTGTAGLISETACSNLPISAYTANTPETYCLTASSYGTGAGYHGPTITRTLTADASGEIGASEFTFTYRQKMCIGNSSADTKQMGAFQMHLIDANNNVVAGIRILKNTVGKTGSLIFFINGERQASTSIDLSYNNQYFGSGSNAVKTSKVIKSGNTVTFNIGGYSRAFVDDSITNVVVKKVTFAFEQYGSTEALEYNGLISAKFIKNNCDTFKNVPNKFSANDILKADCRNGEIYLNNVLSPELGALGNDWEGFYLTPGLNQIGIAYSEWVESDYAPKFIVKYREVFL